MTTSRILAGLAMAAALGTGVPAFAAPLDITGLGPLSIQYFNDEQVSTTNSITSPGGATEGNWGIIQVTSIFTSTPNLPLGSDITGVGSTVFVQGQNGGNQILGIFYGLQISSSDPTAATGGHLDLYFWNSATPNLANEISSLANIVTKRTAQDQYTGFTCPPSTPGCTFLGELNFVNGVRGSADPTSTSSNVVPGAGADGTAESYLDVNLSKPGLWTNTLDSSFFTLAPNGSPLTNPRDVRLTSRFSSNGGTGWSTSPNIVGLTSSDPARMDAIPEPASLALLGSALVGFGVVARRRRRQA